MDFLSFLDFLHIDPMIVMLVICSGFFQEKYLCGSTWSKDSRRDAAYKTLVVSVLVSLIYILLFHLQDKSVTIMWAKYFISYFVATSLYELLIRPFRKWLAKKTGDNDQTPGA